MKAEFDNKDEVSSAIFWKYGERLIAQIVGLSIQIILARCLAPDHFGELAILLSIVSYATMFVQSGISTYIIQKEDLEEADIAAALFLTVFMALLMYAIIFLAAPFIEEYYASNNLCKALRVIAIVLIPSGISSVYQGILSKYMRFKMIFLRSLFVVPLSGIIGIILAKNGMGLWALVYQYVINHFFTCIVFALGSWQRFKLDIVWDKVVKILYFGGNILMQSFFLQSLVTIRTLVVGKIYSAEELAYFDKGMTYTDYLYSGISTSAASVLLPTLAAKQVDHDEVKDTAKRFLSICMFIVAPLLMIFAATSSCWIPIFLTEKWEEAIPFVMIFCFAKLTAPIVSINLQIYYATGKVNTTRNLVTIECILSLIALLMTYRIGLIAIAWGCVVVSIFDIFIFSLPNARNINYTLKEQINDIYPSLICSGIVYVILRLLLFIPLPKNILLVLQIFVGFTVYITLLAISNNETFIFLKKYFMNFVSNKFCGL